jgi:hypothetical protein
VLQHQSSPWICKRRGCITCGLFMTSRTWKGMAGWRLEADATQSRDTSTPQTKRLCFALQECGMRGWRLRMGGEGGGRRAGAHDCGGGAVAASDVDDNVVGCDAGAGGVAEGVGGLA